MNHRTASWALPRLDQQLALWNEGADLASRNLERLLSTQLDGYRDWMRAIQKPQPPASPLEGHLDHGLQLGCTLFVAQVSAVTDAMQLAEKAWADQQRDLLGQLGSDPRVAEPVRPALCLSACAADSLSKATRQVANFASNRFAAAAVSALQQARDKMAEPG